MRSGERLKLIVTNCCLIICYLIVPIERVSRATSNVHSVWLDASGSSLPRPDPTGNSNRVLSQRTGLWSVAPQDLITNSASSLQPSIVDLDQNDNLNSKDIGTKRFDSEPVVTFINDTSELDLATTGDRHNQRRANNDTNNGHVQFDEDTSQKSSARSSASASSLSTSSSSSLVPSHQPKVSSNLNEQDELILTENYSNTNNIDPTSQSNAVGFEDFIRVSPKTSVDASPIVVQNNSSSQSPYGIEHTTRTSVDSNDGPSIYYLTDADRWNKQQAYQQQQQQQQHPINSNNQLNDPSQLSSHISLPQNRDNNLFSSSTSANQPLGYSVDKRWHPQQSAVESSTATTLSNSRRKLHNSGTQYDLRESHQIQSPIDSNDFDSSQRRRAIEHNRPDQRFIHFVDQLAHQHDPTFLTQPLQLTTPLPYPSMSKNRQKRPYAVRSPHPYAFKQTGTLSGPLIVQHPQLQLDNYHMRQSHAGKMTNNINRRPPQRDHLQQQQHQRPIKHHSRRLKSSTSTRNSWLDPQANQRSFIQNYVPSFSGYRPKLKTPSILSNWMSPPVAGSQRLENSFYSNLDNSPANFQQRPDWNSANYHYYNYEHPSFAINQHQQQAKSSHLYSLIQPGSVGNINKNFYQKPTLAPPLSLLNGHHDDLAQASQIRSQQHQRSSANFIPVVAVSVTKTSPLPAVHSDRQTGATDLQSNTETDYYHQPKAKRRDHHYQQQAKVHFDDYGNYASGSSGNPATFGGNQQRVAYQSPVETTTVKSALFGYLPHEAERPLMSAMNLFSPLQQQLASDSSHREASLYRPRQQYLEQHQQINHIDQQQQQQHQHHLNDWSQMQNNLEEPPTPLGLQLQANSYVQNDIAHPFGSSNSIESAADQRTPLFYLDATNSANYNQFSKQDLPIVQSHQQLMNSLIADSSLRNPHLLAAASELNPLMPVVFASPQQPIASGHSQDSQESAELVQDQSHHLQHQHQQHQHQQRQHQSNQAEQSRGSSALNNKGNKKRSGDFFASAGQLLLSALPLLLAPTLGLMFASSPNAVARYHGHNSVGSELGNGLHSSAIPSSYMSGLNQGMVSNASPAPLLFTPSPPVINRYSSNESLAGVKKATPTTTLPTTTTTLMTTTPEPTSYDNSNIRAHQYRPTLGPIQRLASWTGSTPLPTMRNYSIILTTLAPPPFYMNSTDKSRTNSTYDSDSNSNSNSTTHNSGDNGDFDLTTTHTLVLIQTDDDSHVSTASNNSSRSKDNSTSSEKVTSHYELGGYEGTDFEAHVASLRKSNDYQRVKSSPSQEKSVDRNRYHYTQVHHDNPLDESSQQIRNSNKPKNNSKTPVKVNEDNEPEEKLFPVSRWPTAHHRKTVSLVTSNGSKTMPDSSDKYSLDLIGTQRGIESVKMDFSSEITQTNGTMYNNPMQQVYRRRTKRDLSSTISSNEIISNSTLGDVKKLVKIVKKRRLKKLKEPLKLITTKSSNIATNNSKDPMLSESSSGRIRLIDQAKREDSNSEPTAHIIATMVAQMNDTDDGMESETDRENRLYRQELAERTLRDQLLRKKIILDNLASNNMYSPSLQETQRHSALRRRRPSIDSDEEALDDRDIDRNLSSGGRARLTSERPIEVISTKVKLRKGLDEQKFRKQHTDDQDEEREANLILADDTRKALAKFGNLLIKDTLQVPYDSNSSEENSEKSRRENNNTTRHNIRRRKLATNHRQLEQEEGDQQRDADRNDISATERTFPRTTTYPPILHEEYMNHQYRHDMRNNTMDHIQPPYNHHNYSLSGSQRHRYPIRDQVNLIPDNGDSIGNGYGLPDDGGRFGPRDERHRDYDGPMNLVAGRYAQPDRYNRSESHSNFPSSREPSPIPLNQGGYSSHYSRPPSREPPPRSHYESRGHHYPPVPTNYPHPQPHPIQNNNTYLPANHRPIDDYYDIRRENYSHHHLDDQHNYNKYPADSRYPAASQDSESWPPRSNSHHEHRDYQPAGYSPPVDRDSSSQQQQQQQQVSRSIAGDSSAVNEYLKRVQFSDSDRDKLMASYLTCDGLLNDNDHCLERLSCEFSDPQNLEKANKLDRAVSSILLGHILVNTYIPNQFKLRLKSASLFGYTHSGNCSKYVCSKLAKSTGHV